MQYCYEQTLLASNKRDFRGHVLQDTYAGECCCGLPYDFVGVIIDKRWLAYATWAVNDGKTESGWECCQSDLTVSPKVKHPGKQ